MPDIWVDVDTNVIIPVNLMPLLDDTDFKSIETAVVYNSAGMALTWNFVTSAGAVTETAVTPTTGGNYDWGEPLADKGMYTIEIPASGGASINNDTEGYGWFTGVCTGVLPWRSPVIGFRRAALNDLLVDGGTASTNLEDFFDGTGYAGGTAKLTVDTVAISGDTTAADNCEAMFDGTGYAGGTIRLKTDVDTIKTQAVTCGAGVTVLASVGTAATSTAQTGDCYARLGANGASLTALPWNAAWDAEVESECQDALVADNLDHLCKTATAAADMTTEVSDGTIISRMLSKTSDTSTYDLTTDSLEANRDNIGTTGASLTIAAVTGAVGSVTGAVGSVTGAVGSVTGNVGGNVAGSVASVSGAVGSVTGNVGGNVTGTIGGMSAAALKDFFDTDSTTTYASAVSGSVVKEIVDNAGGSALTTADIADAVWDEVLSGHTGAGSASKSLSDVLVDTAEIGTAGAGLTAVPWNATWDAEVQSECTDALNAYDPPTKTEQDTAFTEIKGATWSAATDTLELIRDKETDLETDTQDLQTQVGTDGAGLTALPWNAAWDAEVESEVDDALGSGTGTALTAIPWNASWDAEVQSECTDALNVYDPPTKTEQDTAFTEIKGATWSSATDTLENIRDKETDLETDTQDLQTQVGTDGAGLTALPWNANWDAEVQSEVDDALVANNLDHLCKTATAGTDMTTEVADGTVLSRLLSKTSDTSTYNPTTDALEASADAIATNGTDINSVLTNQTLITGAGFDTDTDSLVKISDALAAGVDLAAGNLFIKKNTALNGFTFLMVSDTDHVTPATGLTITATRSLDGAAFGACANTAAELSDGIYKINLANTDTNGSIITLKFTATDADARYITLVTQA